MTKYSLAINECPHGIKSISLDDENCGIRLTSSKHCGRWRIVKSWPVGIKELESIIKELTIARESLNES